LVLGGTVVTAQVGGLTSDVSLLVNNLACTPAGSKTTSQLLVTTPALAPGAYQVKVVDAVSGAVSVSPYTFTYSSDPFAIGVDQNPGTIAALVSGQAGVNLAAGSMPKGQGGVLLPLHYVSPEGIVVDVPVAALPAGVTGAFLVARSSDTAGHLFAAASLPTGIGLKSPVIDLHLIVQTGTGGNKVTQELQTPLAQAATIQFPVVSSAKLSVSSLDTSLDALLEPIVTDPAVLTVIGQSYSALTGTSVSVDVTTLGAYAMLGKLVAMDIDNANGVNAVDVQLAINAALGQGIGGLDADVNGDHLVNAVDIQLVINAALGL
jgi:hypothetical protein